MSRFLYWLLARYRVELALIHLGFDYSFVRHWNRQGGTSYSVRIWRRQP